MSDLFSQYSKSRKRVKDLSHGLYISPEIFITIVILYFLSLVVVFSWGVKRGKAIVHREIEEGMYQDVNTTVAADDFKKSDKESVKKQASNSEEIKDAPALNQPEAAVNSSVPEKGNRNYAVQLIVYKSQRYADKEIEWLKANKYPFIKEQKNGKIIISAGPYGKDEAKFQMQKLRQRYKDCFVKLLKK